MLILTNAVTISAAIGAIQITPYNNMLGITLMASRGSGIFGFVPALGSGSAGSRPRKTLEPEPYTTPDVAGKSSRCPAADGAAPLPLPGLAPIKARATGTSAA